MGLAELLAKKRADAALPKPTVDLYVALYNANPRALYLDYMREFRILVNWLGLPESSGKRGHIPPILGSYEMQEIAKILCVDQYEVYIAALARAVASSDN